jgi:hypothetical protein
MSRKFQIALAVMRGMAAGASRAVVDWLLS